MHYEAELTFLNRTLQRMQLQTWLLREDSNLDERPDVNLRKLLGDENAYGRIMSEVDKWVKNNTVYRVTDSYLCHYAFMLLPTEDGHRKALLLGPYMTFRMNEEQILEEAERLQLAAWQTRKLQDYYLNIPVIGDETPLFAIINTFAETLWGEGAAYELVDINYEASLASETAPQIDETDASALFLRMKAMETRYAYENDLMELVSKGLVHRAEQMLTKAALLSMEKRSADPLRNIRYYCISCNTLLRKAAERGGVHPLYLDKASSEFADKIERISSLDDGQELIGRMARSYCRLVKRNSGSQYSAPVQRTLSYIDANLAGVLSLKILADIQELNANYLSTLFKKETGHSVTEYINQQRMELAARLLSSTKLQIQTVAQHCGISDVNYFSKLFKKYRDKTPTEFRADFRRQIL